MKMRLNWRFLPSQKAKVIDRAQPNPNLPGDEILILGSGPSTRVLLPNLGLIRSDVKVFGMGLQLRYYADLEWWPDYWALTDSKVVFAHLEEIKELIKKAPHETLIFLPQECEFDSDRKIEWVPHSSTGSYAMRRSRELGFVKIYLLGIEGDYVERLEEESILLGPEREKIIANLGKLSDSVIYVMAREPRFNPNYFSDTYHRVGDIYSKPLGAVHRDQFNQEFNKCLAANINVVNLSPINRLPIPSGPLTAILNMDGKN